MGKLKARAAADLQQNLMQNRTQFIKISKEAEKLKGEMRTLRNLMSELKTNTTALRTTSGESGDPGLDGALSPTMSKRDKRSSVADRSALWNSQMQVRLTELTQYLNRGIWILTMTTGSVQKRRRLPEVLAKLLWPPCDPERRPLDRA